MSNATRVSAKAVMVFALLISPLFAQHGDVGDVYAMGGYGYSRTSVGPGLSFCDDKVGGFFSCSSNVPHVNGSFRGGIFGGGMGLKVDDDGSDEKIVVHPQVEFFRVRNSGSSLQPYFNTGAVNLFLEKRKGRIRPGGIILGLGGASDGKAGYFFAQTGAGVAFQLTDKLYLRPQVRAQGWMHGLGSRTAWGVTALVALGYRF